MLKKTFRKPYRTLLTKITKNVIEKHHPRIIAVVGNGQTSIARELIYHVLKSKFAVRRNLESPESEFSVPLTIIGHASYPSSAIEWVSVIIKSIYNLNKIKPYEHFLVLEINFNDNELLQDWLKITAPEVLFIVGSMSFDYSSLPTKKVVKIAMVDSTDVLAPFRLGVEQVAKYLEIDSNDVETAFQTFSLPVSKIRYLPGINESAVIDATYYYFPIKLEAVLELVDTTQNNIILFSSLKDDVALIQGKKILINPENYIPKKEDTIILRGPRTKTLQEFERFVEKTTPLF